MAEEDGTGIVSSRVDKIWLSEDGIIHIVVLPGAEYAQADARAGIATVIRISSGKKHPLLVDIRRVKSIDRVARREFASGTNVTALALLIASPVSKVIGNVFVGLNKVAVPVRLFTSEAEATQWLKGFLK